MNSASGESPFKNAAFQFALNNSPDGAFKSFSAVGKCQEIKVESNGKTLTEQRKQSLKTLARFLALQSQFENLVAKNKSCLKN